MLDHILTKDCRKLLKAIIKLNKNNIEYPTITDLINEMPKYSKNEIMSIAKHCEIYGFVYINWVNGEIVLIENTYIGNHYLKTRGIENFRFWLPIIISILAFIMSGISLFRTI